MLAWMDEEALRRTRETGEAWFWSRSRRRALAQGRDVRRDARRRRAPGRLRRRRDPPARPARTVPSATPARSPASRPGSGAASPSARASRPEGSYVAGLLEQGPGPAARKVGEEGVEAALAGASRERRAPVEELADLWFHSYVLLAARGLDPAAVEDELATAASRDSAGRGRTPHVPPAPGRPSTYYPESPGATSRGRLPPPPRGCGMASRVPEVAVRLACRSRRGPGCRTRGSPTCRARARRGRRSRPRARPGCPTSSSARRGSANEAVNVNAPTAASPSACTPSWWKPPP